MKLLIFAKTISPPTETFVYNYIKSLSAKVNVKVICLARENETLFPLDNVEVLHRKGHWLKDRLWNRKLIFNAKDPSLRAGLQNALSDFRPDAILCFFADQSLYVTDNLVNQKIPVFIMALGYDASQLLHQSVIYRWRMRRLISRSNVHVSVVSEALKNNLGKYRIGDDVFVLPLCADTTFFKPTTVKKDNPGLKTFIQVSSFVEKKGHLYTLMAFSTFKKANPDRPFSLIFAGGGPMEEEMKKKAEKLNLKDEVIFRGWQSKEEVRSLLEKADVFVHHSITSSSGDMEGMPTAILEAMAMALPVISTFHSGIPEVVEHGINGILVPEMDVDAYARAIEELYFAGNYPQNREKIISSFDLENQSSRLLEWMKSRLPEDNQFT